MTVEFTMPAPAKLLNANQRLHWTTRSALTQAWRNAAHIHAMKARRGWRTVWPWQRAHIDVTIRFPDARRRDVGNFYPTAKAIVDGIVDAGLLPDDNDDHITGPFLHRGELCPGQVAQLVIRIEKKEDAA